MTDKSRAKNRFALGAPSNCTEELFFLYQDQLIALNEIVEAERQQDEAEGKVCNAVCYRLSLQLSSTDIYHQRMVKSKRSGTCR